MLIRHTCVRQFFGNESKGILIKRLFVCLSRAITFFLFWFHLPFFIFENFILFFKYKNKSCCKLFTIPGSHSLLRRVIKVHTTNWKKCNKFFRVRKAHSSQPARVGGKKQYSVCWKIYIRIRKKYNSETLDYNLLDISLHGVL